MDKFKNYLKEQEEDMNADSPAPELWDQIRQKTAVIPGQKKNISLTIRYLAAASLLALVASGVMLLNTGKPGVIHARVVEKKITSTTNSRQAIKKTMDTVFSPQQENVTVVNKNLRQQKASGKMKTSEDRQLKQVADETALIGEGYSRLINLQIERVRSTPLYTESPGYFSQFPAQLKKMDKDEADLKKDIQKYGLNDPLLEQLINIYQQKLNLLKSLQMEINKMNNGVKENMSPSDTLKPYYLHL